MTTDLKSELERLADATPTYDVFDGAVELHRRRRGRRIAVVAAAAVAVVLTATAVPGLIGAPRDNMRAAAQPDDPGSLPRTLSQVKEWTPDPQDHPAGPAALLFSDARLDFDYSSVSSVVVGLREDSYRVLREGSNSGDGTLLSPDGARVAYRSDSGALEIVDLRTGDAHTVASRPGAGVTAPVSWSPDGRTLLVKTTDATRTAAKYVYTQLGLVEIATGTYLELPGADNVDSGPIGLTGAFSADGTKVAYQVYDHVNIASRAGKHLGAIGVDKDHRLAGKGAWTPDGTALAIVDRRHCCDDTPASSATTEVHLRAIGGAQEIVGRFGAVTGAKMIQVQGWAADGSLVAVASYVDPGQMARSGFPSSGVVTDVIGRVEVVALRRDAPPTVLLAPPRGVFTVDIAQAVIAGGRSRPGADPQIWPMQTGYLIAAAILVGVPLLFIVLVIWAIVAVVRRRGEVRHR